MWRAACAGVGIGTQATRRASPHRVSCLQAASISSHSRLDTRAIRAPLALQCIPTFPLDKKRRLSERPARERSLGGVRWHSLGGDGHSHSGVADLDDDDAANGLTGEEAKAADRITWIGVYINVVLSAAKGVAGVTFHSAGLLADAVHSMSDLVSDGITLLALKYCTRPPDQFQPYGYGKYETMGALSVSLLLVGGSLAIINHSFDTLMILVEPATAPSLAALDAKLASLSIDADVAEAIKSAIPHSHGGALDHAHHDDKVMLHPAALGIAAVSVAAKEALYRATMVVAERLHSSVLIANAWHHRSDAISSVVAMGGIGLSLAGFPMFDPIAGMLVGGIILKMGGEIGWDAIKDLCDAQLPAKTVNKLSDAVQSVIHSSNGEIVTVRQLRSRKIGRQVHVDLTLVLRDSKDAVTFERACEWKQRVKDAIQRDVPRVKDIIVELATTSQASSTVFDYDHDIEAHRDGHSHSHGDSHSHSHGASHGHSHGSSSMGH